MNVLIFLLWAWTATHWPDDSIAPTPSAVPSAYHVTPAGSSRGDGSSAQPWDLQTALSGGNGRIQPGDTIWLREGRYVGDDFTTRLVGTAAARITFRQYPGERATIDGRLLARGAYLDFWGFEITQSAPLSKVEQQLLDGRTDHGRYINLVLHDANTHGMNFWNPGVDAEMYGNIIYNNGTHDNLDHGVYVHNETGTKRITDNIFFNNFARGIQNYAGSGNAVLRNVHVEGNIAFNNGTISVRSTRVNLLYNAEAPMEGMRGVGNLLYFSPGAGGINIRLGKHRFPYRDLELRENYVVGGRAGLEIQAPWERLTVTNNTFIGYPNTSLVSTAGALSGGTTAFRGNVFHGAASAKAWRHEGTSQPLAGWVRASGVLSRDSLVVGPPSRPRVFVRPNRYEPGRAHVAIYNWGRRAAVEVDLSGALRPGDRYEVHNVQDLWGAPVVTGTFTGAAVAFPMAGVEPPPPIGRRAPAVAPRTGPDFDVFLVRRRS